MAYIFGSDLNHLKSQRVSLVPYTIKDNELYMMFGIHNHKSNKLPLSDFPTNFSNIITDNTSQHILCDEITCLGGSSKNKETIIETAEREFREESKGIFGKTITMDLLMSSVAVIKPNKCDYKGITVIFVPVTVQWIELSQQLFEITPNKRCDVDEISSLKWISERDFYTFLNSELPLNGMVVWEKLRRFYKTIFSGYLKELLIARWFWPSFQEYISSNHLPQIEKCKD